MGFMQDFMKVHAGARRLVLGGGQIFRRSLHRNACTRMLSEVRSHAIDIAVRNAIRLFLYRRKRLRVYSFGDKNLVARILNHFQTVLENSFALKLVPLENRPV